MYKKQPRLFVYNFRPKS